MSDPADGQEMLLRRTLKVSAALAQSKKTMRI